MLNVCPGTSASVKLTVIVCPETCGAPALDMV
jgi:hypothetical protein